MNHVVILGAGFSRAVSSRMPLTDELGTEIVADPEVSRGASFPAQFRGGRFESWLSRLAESQPDLTDAANLENRAAFMRVSQRIRDVVWLAQQGVLGEPLKWEIQRFVGVLHAHRSVVATFNYDTLVENAISSPPRRDWQSGPGVVRGMHLINNRPPVPVIGGSFAPYMARSFKLLKLHGSIDTYWVADDHTGATIARLPSEAGGWSASRVLLEEDVSNRNNLLPGRVPFIIPPAAAKSSFYINPLTRQLWREASDALSAAGQVDIVGYSLPLTDLVTSGMLADVLAPSDSRIRVVNLSPEPVSERLEALGVAQNRISGISGEDCISSYVEVLERETGPVVDPQAETVRAARQQDLPVLIAISEQNAARVIEINVSGEDSTTLRLTVGPTGYLSDVIANAATQEGTVVRAADLIARCSVYKHLVVDFGNNLRSHIVDMIAGKEYPGGLILIPSTMPTKD